MRTYKYLVLLSTLTHSLSGYAKLEAHEWGTFTSLVGSDGITQHGMYHEDEELPRFVHEFGETLPVPPALNPTPLVARRDCDPGEKACFRRGFFNSNVVTQKMETPVIYFYSDKTQRVNVEVKFPEGIFTETYPAPVSSSPQPNDRDLKVSNGQMRFVVDVLNQKQGNIPAVEAQNIYGHARKVNSNIVMAGNEQEKFIFYRGLGRFQPRFDIKSTGGNLTLTASAKALPQAAFLVDVDPYGHSQMLQVSDMKANESVRITKDDISRLRNHGSRARSSKHFFVGNNDIREMLVQSLVQAGLYRDEAVAMIDTWEHGYLKVPGLRLLYVLPRAEVDEVLPLKISPAPENLQRAFVGRIEILLDTEEKELLEDIKVQNFYFKVSSLGRFAEPKLRRLQQVYLSGKYGPVEPVTSLVLERLIENSKQFSEVNIPNLH